MPQISSIGLCILHLCVTNSESESGGEGATARPRGPIGMVHGTATGDRRHEPLPVLKVGEMGRELAERAVNSAKCPRVQFEVK